MFEPFVQQLVKKCQGRRLNSHTSPKKVGHGEVWPLVLEQEAHSWERS